MENEAVYLIPLRYEYGIYDAASLPHRGSCLQITRTDFGALRYIHPEYGTEITEYEAPADTTVLAVYAKTGHLLRAEYLKNGSKKLLWTRTGASRFMEYAKTAAEAVSERLLQSPQPAARLLFEWFYDGDAVDFAVRTGTHEDMQAIRARCGDADTDAVNNPAAYPAEKRITCDIDTLRIMLLCTNPAFRETRFSDTVWEMQRLISERMLFDLRKTDDYRVITEEYD